MPYALNAIITCSMRGPLRIYGAGSHLQGECCADWHFTWRQTRWERPVTAEQCTQAPEMSPSPVPSLLTARWHYTMHTTTTQDLYRTHSYLATFILHSSLLFCNSPIKLTSNLLENMAKHWSKMISFANYSLCSVMYPIGNVIVFLCVNLRHGCICGMMCL